MVSDTDPGARPTDASRAIEIVAGLTSVGISVVVLANPLLPIRTLVVLLAAAVAIDGARSFLTAGMVREWWRRVERNVAATFQWVRRIGYVGIGLIAVAILVAVLLSPTISQLTLLYLLAFGVVILSLGRILRAVGRENAVWFRSASAGTGVIALVLVLMALVYPSIALATIAVVLALSLLLSGIQSVVSGLHPTDPRQVVLLKVVLFALLYGLVLINWIDLFGKSVPAYGVWLVLIYFAPFVVLLVFEGLSEWPLALSLGLLVSLANDVGYYFVGNLLFGFHQNLVVWIAGQLGFYGTRLVTIFEGGNFSIPVDSWLMGLSIYARAILVTVGLYYWWRHPARIVARLPPAAPA